MGVGALRRHRCAKVAGVDAPARRGAFTGKKDLRLEPFLCGPGAGGGTLPVGAVEDPMRHPLGMAKRVADGEGAAPRHAGRREGRVGKRRCHCLRILCPGPEANLAHETLRQTAAALVMAGMQWPRDSAPVQGRQTGLSWSQATWVSQYAARRSAGPCRRRIRRSGFRPPRCRNGYGGSGSCRSIGRNGPRGKLQADGRNSSACFPSPGIAGKSEPPQPE